MLNVCFGDSECGMLKFALRGEPVTYSRLLLNLGHISLRHFSEDRKKWIDEFFQGCSKWTRAKILKKDNRRFNSIISAAEKEKELRIWYAGAPYSKCGFYYLVYSLQGIDCRIYVVEMPENIGYRGAGFDRSWGEANTNEAYGCLKFERELSEKDRTEIARKWEKLANENSELRLNIDGEITSLLIDYLDDEIISYAPKDEEFRLGRLVGKTLGCSVHCVSDSFIADRIEAMIDCGRILVVGNRPKKAEDYYKTTLRVAPAENISSEHKLEEGGV